jgi:hypothetical protein
MIKSRCQTKKNSPNHKQQLLLMMLLLCTPHPRYTARRCLSLEGGLLSAEDGAVRRRLPSSKALDEAVDGKLPKINDRKAFSPVVVEYMVEVLCEGFLLWKAPESFKVGAAPATVHARLTKELYKES